MGDARLSEEHILFIVPFPEPKDLIDSIKNKHPNVRITFREQTFAKGQIVNKDSYSDDIFHDATILVTLFTLPPNPKLAPRLKLIHLISAGVDKVSETPIWKDTDIIITNSSGVHGPQIAEWVIMQILTNSHKERVMLEWQRKHVWGKHADLAGVTDGVGQRLGVLGYGAIGRQTAHIAKAMGYDVIAYTATPKKTPESKKDSGYIVPGTGDPNGEIPSAWYSGLDRESLHEFLGQDIDILLVSVPLTPQTRHFISEKEFEILGRKNAFIANISRGAVLQQDELIKALKKSKDQGGLRGAALDVTDPEPLDEGSELWDLDNVAITPHVSGLGTTYAERSLAILEQNLTRLEKGQKLLNVVDRKKGY